MINYSSECRWKCKVSSTHVIVRNAALVEILSNIFQCRLEVCLCKWEANHYWVLWSIFNRMCHNPYLNVFLHNRFDFFVKQRLNVQSHQFHRIFGNFVGALLHWGSSIVSGFKGFQHTVCHITDGYFLHVKKSKTIFLSNIDNVSTANNRKRLTDVEAIVFVDPLRCKLDVVELDSVCHELFESSEDDVWCTEELSVDWFDPRHWRWMTILASNLSRIVANLHQNTTIMILRTINNGCIACSTTRKHYWLVFFSRKCASTLFTLINFFVFFFIFLLLLLRLSFLFSACVCVRNVAENIPFSLVHWCQRQRMSEILTCPLPFT